MRVRPHPTTRATSQKKSAPRQRGALQSGLGRVAQESQLGLALQALERPRLRLAGLRDTHPELPGSLLDRVLALAAGAVPEVDDAHLLGRELLEEAADPTGMVGPDDVHLDIGVLD